MSTVTIDATAATGYGHETPDDPWAVWILQRGTLCRLRRLFEEEEARLWAKLLNGNTDAVAMPLPMTARPPVLTVVGD